MPTLAFTCRLMPPRWNGCSRAAAMWLAVRRASSSEASRGRGTANSSPPGGEGAARPARLGEGGARGQGDGNLVAAEPGDGVGRRAELSLQAAAHLDQEAVAVVVAERVVDVLELVEVHDQQG